MSQPLTISRFYKIYVADSTDGFSNGSIGMQRSFHALTRRKFVQGLFSGICRLIERVVCAVFYLLATVFTLGNNPIYQASLKQNMAELLPCAGAIFVGCLGIIFCEPMNRYLELPSSAPLSDYIKPTHLPGIND